MKVLHLITKPDEFAEKIIDAQRADHTVEIEDLTGANADYAALLEKIFAADSIHIW